MWLLCHEQNCGTVKAAQGKDSLPGGKRMNKTHRVGSPPSPIPVLVSHLEVTLQDSIRVRNMSPCAFVGKQMPYCFLRGIIKILALELRALLSSV